MLVKNIMIPVEKLTVVDVQTTIADTIALIDTNHLLSLPVVTGKKFVGVISKKYIFEEYFNGSEEKEIFLKRPIVELMKTKIAAVKERDLVEVPGQVLAEHNLQFVPVENEKGEFIGIVTHKAIFKTFNKILGVGHTRIEVTTRDVKGRLATLTEIITKQGVNIISIAEIDIEVMNLREIILRVDVKNVKALIQALNEGGFTVRRVDECNE
ncbi:CBS domain-containing protein [Niameybacter massiliensis]|uniref:CBS domain-containing protein n=1 Tax=Holtiella tumoricola TaxID=3018743 RepID=A0AA42DL95_9FIRM|nr:MULTISPECIES: CBS domain-containing protein [Lachnospirales]MDA3730753.1 CBS domain-containing protein [Holtiella tumoricola]